MEVFAKPASSKAVLSKALLTEAYTLVSGMVTFSLALDRRGMVLLWLSTAPSAQGKPSLFVKVLYLVH